jgi:hypothetical protein
VHQLVNKDFDKSSLFSLTLRAPFTASVYLNKIQERQTTYKRNIEAQLLNHSSSGKEIILPIVLLSVSVALVI